MPNKNPITNMTEYKQRVIALRQQILDLIRAEGPMTSLEIARKLGEHPPSVISCCNGLSNHNWLRMGDLVKSDSVVKKKRYHKVHQWMLGNNPDPLPDILKLCDRPVPKKPKSFQITASAKQSTHNPITAEDLAWMEKYRRQRAQRYARLGQPVPSTRD